MVRAVVNRGEIQPLDPLPPDWREGQALRVEKADEPELTPEEIDREFATLAQLCAQSDAAEEDALGRAIEEAHRVAKEQVRRRMGLP